MCSTVYSETTLPFWWPYGLTTCRHALYMRGRLLESPYYSSLYRTPRLQFIGISGKCNAEWLPAAHVSPKLPECKSLTYKVRPVSVGCILPSIRGPKRRQTLRVSCRVWTFQRINTPFPAQLSLSGPKTCPPHLSSRLSARATTVDNFSTAFQRRKGQFEIGTQKSLPADNHS